MACYVELSLMRPNPDKNVVNISYSSAQSALEYLSSLFSVFCYLKLSEPLRWNLSDHTSFLLHVTVSYVGSNSIGLELEPSHHQEVPPRAALQAPLLWGSGWGSLLSGDSLGHPTADHSLLPQRNSPAQTQLISFPTHFHRVCTCVRACVCCNYWFTFYAPAQTISFMMKVSLFADH